MESEHAVAALSALAHDNRLAIFRLLVRAGPGGVAAGEIAADLDIPNATLSFHLGQRRLRRRRLRHHYRFKDDHAAR